MAKKKSDHDAEEYEEKKPKHPPGKWKCNRCQFSDNYPGRDTCFDCGASRDRPARKIRRRKIGGKRGRNSGKVGTSK